MVFCQFTPAKDLFLRVYHMLMLAHQLIFVNILTWLEILEAVEINEMFFIILRRHYVLQYIFNPKHDIYCCHIQMPLLITPVNLKGNYHLPHLLCWSTSTYYWGPQSWWLCDIPISSSSLVSSNLPTRARILRPFHNVDHICLVKRLSCRHSHSLSNHTDHLPSHPWLYDVPETTTIIVYLEK